MGSPAPMMRESSCMVGEIVRPFPCLLVPRLRMTGAGMFGLRPPIRLIDGTCLNFFVSIIFVVFSYTFLIASGGVYFPDTLGESLPAVWKEGSEGDLYIRGHRIITKSNINKNQENPFVQVETTSLMLWLCSFPRVQAPG